MMDAHTLGRDVQIHRIDSQRFSHHAHLPAGVQHSITAPPAGVMHEIGRLGGSAGSWIDAL